MEVVVLCVQLVVIAVVSRHIVLHTLNISGNALVIRARLVKVWQTSVSGCYGSATIGVEGIDLLLIPVQPSPVELIQDGFGGGIVCVKTILIIDRLLDLAHVIRERGLHSGIRAQLALI